MITAEAFISQAGHAGFDFYTGVPCSYLTPLINGVLSSRDLAYVGATSEGEAVAIAAGAWLAGRRTVVMCQNSGLGNAVNPLTSLNAPFRIPTLFVTTWRGKPGEPDEPQHDVMGRITHDLLSLIGVEHAEFPSRPDQLAPTLDLAVQHMDTASLPFGLVLHKGDVADEPLNQPPPPQRREGQRQDYAVSGPPPTRAEVLSLFLALTDDQTAVVATTGKCGRELFTLADRPQHLYQVGSMGGASGMALGVALNTPRTVVVLDGDGAALMKLGTFATIAAQTPANLIHILLDNGVHDSTGGQATVSSIVDFAGLAIACGYGFAAACSTLDGFKQAFREASSAKGPALIHMRIAPGSMKALGRPTIKPEDVARRFQAFVTSATAEEAS